jgi:hypothetical protein
MSKVITTNDGYLALLDAVYFAGFRMGNLSEDGLEWGGEDSQKFSLFAAQVRSNPVKEFQTRAATNELTGKMIELVPDNCVALMGGTINQETGAWEAPANMGIVEGSVKILAGTGQTVDIKRAALTTSYVRGGLGGDKTLGIQFGLQILAPLDGSSPFSIYPTQPFIQANPTSLSFPKAGGNAAVEIEASGPFLVGKVPAGFTVEVINGRVTVIASANDSGSTRTGELTFVLQADTSQTVKVSLSQSA